MLNKTLKNLYQKIDECVFCRTDKNNLRHIHGYGAMRPELMLVLVNPTYNNISSAPEYQGPRFPFIGVRAFWRVLADGGLINKEIAYNLPSRSKWSAEDTKIIQQELIKNKLFLTNIVKCCYPHGDYPEKNVIGAQINFLKQEIKIIKPKKIIAFGALVYKTLTGKNIKLADCAKNLKIELEKISGLNIPVMPCYFPIGRGNPKKSAEMLKNRGKFSGKKH